MNTKGKTPSKSVPSEPEADSPAKPVRAVKAPAAGETTKIDDKPQKIKMIRDSFTMPEMDYSQLDTLKKKCLRAGVHVKKSELLRAGLLSLAKLPDAALVKAVEAVEKLKTGRPAKV